MIGCTADGTLLTLCGNAWFAVGEDGTYSKYNFNECEHSFAISEYVDGKFKTEQCQAVRYKKKDNCQGGKICTDERYVH